MIRRTSIQCYQAIKDSASIGKFQFDVYEIIVDKGPSTPGEVTVEYAIRNPGTNRGRNEIAKRFTELKILGLLAEVSERPEANGKLAIVCDVVDRMPIVPNQPSEAEVLKAQVLKAKDAYDRARHEYIVKTGMLDV